MSRAAGEGVAQANAVTLATASADGRVSARTVLLKAYDEERLVFESEEYSKKGRQIAENPHVAMTLYWREVHRQLCVTGRAAPLPDEVSDRMWRQRGRPNQAASAVTHEGAEIPSLAAELELQARADALAAGREEIARPASYRAYGLTPATVEFWEGSADRLHRRLYYERDESSGAWSWRRIEP